MSDEQLSNAYNAVPSGHEPVELPQDVDWSSEASSESHDFGGVPDLPDNMMPPPETAFFGTPDTEASEPHNFGEAFDLPGKTAAPPESEFAEAPLAEVATSTVDIAEKREKKKRKKEKKIKTEKRPMHLGVVLSLCFFILALLVLGVLNVLIFTAPQAPGIGGSSTLYYAIGVNVFGLVFALVPFMFWRFNVWKCYADKNEDEAQYLPLFDVLLGIALMVLAIGVLCFLAVIYRYDFMLKPS